MISIAFVRAKPHLFYTHELGPLFRAPTTFKGEQSSKTPPPAYDSKGLIIFKGHDRYGPTPFNTTTRTPTYFLTIPMSQTLRMGSCQLV